MKKRCFSEVEVNVRRRKFLDLTWIDLSHAVLRFSRRGIRWRERNIRTQEGDFDKNTAPSSQW